MKNNTTLIFSELNTDFINDIQLYQMLLLEKTLCTPKVKENGYPIPLNFALLSVLKEEDFIKYSLNQATSYNIYFGIDRGLSKSTYKTLKELIEQGYSIIYSTVITKERSVKTDFSYKELVTHINNKKEEKKNGNQENDKQIEIEFLNKMFEILNKIETNNAMHMKTTGDCTKYYLEYDIISKLKQIKKEILATNKNSKYYNELN